MNKLQLTESIYKSDDPSYDQSMTEFQTVDEEGIDLDNVFFD